MVDNASGTFKSIILSSVDIGFVSGFISSITMWSQCGGSIKAEKNASHSTDR